MRRNTWAAAFRVRVGVRARVRVRVRMRVRVKVRVRVTVRASVRVRVKVRDRVRVRVGVSVRVRLATSQKSIALPSFISDRYPPSQPHNVVCSFVRVTLSVCQHVRMILCHYIGMSVC